MIASRIAHWASVRSREIRGIGFIDGHSTGIGGLVRSREVVAAAINADVIPVAWDPQDGIAGASGSVPSDADDLPSCIVNRPTTPESRPFPVRAGKKHVLMRLRTSIPDSI